MDVLIIICIFVALFMVYLKYKPSIVFVEGKCLLYYSIRSKTGEYTTRDYIIIY